MLKGIPIFFLFLSVLSVSAQDDSSKAGKEERVVLHLKDGSKIKGMLRRSEGDTIRLEMRNGKLIELSRSEVERIRSHPSAGRKEGTTGSSKEEAASDPGDQGKGSGRSEKEKGTKKPKTYYQKGYQVHLSQGWFFGSWGNGAQFQTSHRYRFSPYFAGGFFSGMVFISEPTAAGLFGSDLTPYMGSGISLRGDLLKKSPVVPSWDLRAGIFSAPGFSKGTFFGDLRVGVTFYFGNGNGLSLRSGYQMLDELDKDHKGRGLHLLKGPSFLIELHF
ncbi:MAG: hypothetical protein ABEH38_09400 [Flavobacteriales bacterium]